MFEDALLESSGKIRSGSRYWALATLLFNVSFVAALALLPLLHPAALPRSAMSASLTIPPPPRVSQTKPLTTAVRRSRANPALDATVAPTRVPRNLDLATDPPPPLVDVAVGGPVLSNSPGANAGVLTESLFDRGPVVVTRPEEKRRPSGPVRISSGVAAGALLEKIPPVYPALAKAARVSGAVLLHATISKSGTIESLQVMSGPEMLRASALDAVRQWRYRPYLLNGEATEVDTTVTVNFTFGG